MVILKRTIVREYELIIDEALGKGLSPGFSVPFNSPFLSQALGFRCGKYGIEAFQLGENPIVAAITMHYNWPFPQFIVGEKFELLVIRDLIAAEDRIYSITNNYATATLIATIDVATYGTGWLVDVADFGEYVFMTNGVAMVFWDVVGVDWDVIVSSAAIPLLGTVCNHKGQAVGGNVQSTWYGCDETFYAWSEIGSISFIPSITNEAGYRRCPYGGIVYHTRRLGDNVVGYSSKGITLMTPVMDPTPTYKFSELLDTGLHNRGAVAGNYNRHVFVGEDLIVREITDKGIKELDYKYWMEDLDNEIIVTYDRSSGDFFIGDSEKTYLLSPYGLTEIPQHPSAVWRKDEDNVYMLPDAADAGWKPIITSEIFNMGYSGQKTIFEIETDALIATGPYTSVDWAMDLYTWGFGSFIPLNNLGIATAITTGNYFMLNIRFNNIYDVFRISYIRARYKMTDLRGIRGIYAPPPRGQ